MFMPTVGGQILLFLKIPIPVHPYPSRTPKNIHAIFSYPYSEKAKQVEMKQNKKLTKILFPTMYDTPSAGK